MAGNSKPCASTKGTSARRLRQNLQELIVEDLLEDWPEGEADLSRVEAFARANASYRNLLLSEDGRFTTVAIRTNSFSSAAGERPDDLAAGFGDEEPAAAGDGSCVQQLLTACAACIAADQKVTQAEGELLRAIADALACPMPPLLPGQLLA